MSLPPDFLQAILDAPDDDVPRLQLADWLEEQGDPRGEFIRIQCHLARWEPDLHRRAQLQQREQELLGRHEAEWVGSLRDFCTA